MINFSSPFVLKIICQRLRWTKFTMLAKSLCTGIYRGCLHKNIGQSKAKCRRVLFGFYNELLFTIFTIHKIHLWSISYSFFLIKVGLHSRNDRVSMLVYALSVWSLCSFDQGGLLSLLFHKLLLLLLSLLHFPTFCLFSFIFLLSVLFSYKISYFLFFFLIKFPTFFSFFLHFSILSVNSFFSAMS